MAQKSTILSKKLLIPYISLQKGNQEPGELLIFTFLNAINGHKTRALYTSDKAVQLTRAIDWMPTKYKKKYAFFNLL